LLYAGSCIRLGNDYCNQYGIDVFDAYSTDNNPAPLYSITQGITTGPYSPQAFDPPVAVDDSGNLYVGTGNGASYGSQPGEVLVYPPGESQPSATLTGIPSAAAIATSAHADVAVQATDGSVYTFEPGTTSPQRTIVCNTGSSPFVAPGGIGYAKDGTLFFGMNYGVSGKNFSGVIFTVDPKATKCHKKVLSAGTSEIDPTTLVISNHKLFFVAETSYFGNEGYIAYFAKGNPNPVVTNNSDEVGNYRDGLTKNKAYVYVAGFGAVFRWPNSCLSGSGCGEGPYFYGGGGGIDLNTAAVYPRSPIGTW
jgi:hypothetical protein